MKNDPMCCYFPTTALFLDDRESFLHSLTLNLAENLSCKMYTKPEDALRTIFQEHSNYRQSAWLANVSNEATYNFTEEHAHLVVDVNIADIHKEIYSAARFKEISVIVVDYAMPSMSGLEFSQLIRELDKNFIKILMITGEADDEVAVKAFNDGIIDRFIKKNISTFDLELNSAIDDLQRSYFRSLSRSVTNNLATNPNCALNDQTFIDFFEDFCLKEKICEYYLVDEHGSFLLLDAMGNPSWLVVKSNNAMDYYNTIAKDNGAPKNIQSALTNRERIPFFFTQQDMEVPVTQWENYLHPAQKFTGHTNEYYYATVKGVDVYDVQPRKILSYKQHLQSLSKEQ